MSGKRSLGTNAILNAIRAGLSVIFPLVTYPYALRMLGADSIGKVSFGNSIVSYFSILAALGVSSYAVREGAKLKYDKKKLNHFVGEILTINLISTGMAYTGLFICLLLSVQIKQYSGLILLQSLSIILTTLGIDWINVIYEDYYLMTVRSIITYIISGALLVLLVHDQEDYYKYASLIVISNGIVCFTNLFYVRKYVKLSFRWSQNLLSHIKPMLIFLANNAAIAVYVNMDMTMLGFMKGDHSAGIYAAAVKVYTTLKNVFIALYAVSLPRLVCYFGNNEIKDYRKTYTDVICGISLLLIPVGVGFICLSDEVMVLLGGIQYIEGGKALRILSLSLIAAIFGGMITALHNIAVKKEKINLKATIYSAAINLILNLYFIDKFDYVGAAITTLFSEMFVLLYCLHKEPDYREYIDDKLIIREWWHAIIASAGLSVYIIWIKKMGLNPLITFFLSIGGSVAVYGIVLMILKDRYLIDFTKKIKDIMLNTLLMRK